MSSHRGRERRHRGHLMYTLWQDIRFGARTLMRSLGFTIVAVGSLALGIGAITSVYSMISAVLINPVPFDDADRLEIDQATAVVPMHAAVISHAFGLVSVAALSEADAWGEAARQRLATPG